MAKKVSKQRFFSTNYGSCILDEANGAQLFFYQHSGPHDRGCTDTKIVKKCANKMEIKSPF